MSKRLTNTGLVSYVEMITKDVDKALSFYKNVFGYEVEKMNIPSVGDYYTLTAPGSKYPMMGIVGLPTSAIKAGVEHSLYPYIAVPNIDEAIMRFKASNSEEIMCKVDFEAGSMALFLDNGFYPIGVVEYKENLFSKEEKKNESLEGIVDWFEVLTENVKATEQFYQKIFDYKIVAATNYEENYLMLKNNKDILGGAICNTPPHLNISSGINYIKNFYLVKDIKTSREKILKNGGRLLTDIIKVPGEGNFCDAKDSNGIIISIIQF